MTPSARLQAAIDILGELERTVKPVDRLLRDWGRAHRFAGSKDRAAIAERVYAVLRHRSSLARRMGGDAPRALVIASLLKDGERDIAALFSGTGYGPAAPTDAECAAIASPPVGEAPLHVRGEFPEFLQAELRRALGDHVLEDMCAMQARAPIDLRVNTLKADRDTVLSALRAQGFEAVPTPFAPLGIRMPFGAKGLDRTPQFENGGFEFQDEAAQIAATLCGARPGMRLLDLAAGAGGKALALAAAMENRGEITATDIRAETLAELERRATRAGATIINTLNLPLPRFSGVEGRNAFDLVLVDAPCSGTGTWRRQPELRWRLTPQWLAELTKTQDELLAEAAGLVRPGGRLVYATCSLLPCENRDRIESFLAAHPDFAIVPALDAWRESAVTEPPPRLGRFFDASPVSSGMDGFFAAILAAAA